MKTHPVGISRPVASLPLEQDTEVGRERGWEQLCKNMTIEFLTVNTKLAEMAALASKDLTTAKKLPPAVLDLMQEFIIGIRTQCLTNWAKTAFVCKSDPYIVMLY